VVVVEVLVVGLVVVVVDVLVVVVVVVVVVVIVVVVVVVVVVETVVDGNSFNLCLKVSRQSLPLSSELNACSEIDAGAGDVRGTGLLNRNPG